MLYIRWKTVAVETGEVVEAERTGWPSYPAKKQQNWTSVGGLQEQPTNYPAVLGTKAPVLNGQGKGGASHQVWIMETNESKPPMKCRDIVLVVETAILAYAG